jgi:IS30 family transposase
MKIAENRELEDFVEAGLYDDLSPEAIAGQIKSHKKNLTPISKDSIRRWIKSVYGRKVEYYRKKKKTRRYRRRAKSPKLNDRIFIDKRPEYINKRRRIGDAEADFMVSGKTGKGIVLNVTDRKSRMTFLELILEVTIENVHQAFQRIKKRFPELKTITTDNDILLQRHKELEALLNVKIYFCDPYSSWQKGTVENSNKYARRDIPKGSNMSKCSSRFIKSIEEKLNRRPLKCLRYKTPKEVLDESKKHKKH